MKKDGERSEEGRRAEAGGAHCTFWFHFFTPPLGEGKEDGGGGDGSCWEETELKQKVPNTVNSWNARQAAVQRPHSEATVLTLFFVCVATPQSHPGGGGSCTSPPPNQNESIHPLDPVQRSLKTLAFKAKKQTWDDFHQRASVLRTWVIWRSVALRDW